jgi:hypothetical protein
MLYANLNLGLEDHYNLDVKNNNFVDRWSFDGAMKIYQSTHDQVTDIKDLGDKDGAMKTFYN